MSAERNRLRWRSQRGMLELDHILGRFLDRQLDRLDAAGRRAYEDLLGLEDPDLYDRILGVQPPDGPGQAEVLALLRELD